MTLQETLGVDAARYAAASQFVSEGFHAIGGWNTVGPVMAFAFVVLSMGIYYREPLATWGKDNMLSRWKERRRMKKHRRKEFNELVADTITDAVEDLYYKQEINREERRALYDRLGKFYPDLKRRGRQNLKDEIAERLAAAQRDADGNVKVIPFPKEEPKPTQKHIVTRIAHVHVL